MFNAAPPADATAVLRCRIGQPLDLFPGSKHAYSNFGYVVLGRIIETVAGTAYEDHVRSRLLEPLGLAAMRIGGTRIEDRCDTEALYYDAPGLARFAAALFDDGRSEPPFPPGLGARMIAPPPKALWTAPEEYYALGWRVRITGRGPFCWHMGTLPGTTALLARDPGGPTAAVLMNTRPKEWEEFNAALLQRVTRQLGATSH